MKTARMLGVGVAWCSEFSTWNSRLTWPSGNADPALDKAAIEKHVPPAT